MKKDEKEWQACEKQSRHLIVNPSLGTNNVKPFSATFEVNEIREKENIYFY